MIMRKNKKGQMDGVFNALGGIAIAVVVLAITLVITFIVISQGKVSVADTIATSSVTASAETVTNASYSALDSAPIEGSQACGTVVDAVSFDVIASGNYTCADAGITWNGVQTGYNSSLLVNYTFKARDGGYNASVTLENAVDTIPAWVPLLIIAVVGGILLSLVALLKRR